MASFAKENPDKQGRDIIEKVKQSLSQFNSCSGKPYPVSSSFGMHYEKITGETVLDNIIKAADDLMYKEKIGHK